MGLEVTAKQEWLGKRNRSFVGSFSGGGHLGSIERSATAIEKMLMKVY
jgi:hypothetical protein